jgi:hypothetical protein
MTWRKRWERSWDEVRHCSDACRRDRRDPLAQPLEDAIVALLDARAADASICPSEAARRVAADAEVEWRELMEPARRAGRRLAARGEVEFTQKGRVVDPSTARGPVRLRRVR